MTDCFCSKSPLDKITRDILEIINKAAIIAVDLVKKFPTDLVDAKLSCDKPKPKAPPSDVCNKTNKIKSFGTGAVYGGWLGFLIGLISMSADFALNQLNTKDFLSANSVLWLVVFYGYCIKVLMKINY